MKFLSVFADRQEQISRCAASHECSEWMVASLEMTMSIIEAALIARGSQTLRGRHFESRMANP
jgi:hypothetical protein